MRAAALLLALSLLAAACARQETAEAEHAPAAEGPVTAEQLNRRAAEDAAAAATAPVEALPPAKPQGPSVLPASDPAPATATPAPEAAHPPADHH